MYIFYLARYRCTYYVRNNIAKVIDHFPRLRLKLLEEYPSRDYKNGAKDYARLNGFRGPANSPLDCWFLSSFFLFFFLPNRYFLLKFYNLAPRDIKHRTSIQDSIYKVSPLLLPLCMRSQDQDPSELLINEWKQDHRLEMA